jgi:glycosyltransferase involved in cell wall biosynthesis
MAVYNGMRYLNTQIDSILSELGVDDELVLIDDASDDGSREWLVSLKDVRIRLHLHDSNAGVRSTFEEGLRRARHDLVFLCDQDDVWLPGKRNAFIAEFDSDQRVLIVISDAEVIDSNDRILASSFMATRGGFKGRLQHTLVRNRYLGCAMALRRELVNAALPIPASVPMHDMWLGAIGSVLGRVRYIDRPLIRYRRHGGNVSPSHRQPWPRMALWRTALFAAVCMRIWRLVLGLHRPTWRPEPAPPSGTASEASADAAKPGVTISDT